MLPNLRGGRKKDGPRGPKTKRCFPTVEKSWSDVFLQTELSEASLMSVRVFKAVMWSLEGAV